VFRLIFSVFILLTTLKANIEKSNIELECVSKGSNLEEQSWGNGLTFLNFLENHSLPLALYYNLAIEDKELVAEIKANQDYFIFKDDNLNLKQALIPISEEMQIHIFKDSDRRYKLDIIPIEYEKRKESVVLSINSSPYQDILKATDNKALASELLSVYRNSVDFRRDLRKNDKLAIIYTQKYRLGELFSDPKIEASMLETNRKDNYLFLYTDGRYYNDKAVAVDGYLLQIPLKYRRISSKFTLKRYHPILKKYRAHLGIDYAAPKGTYVKASGAGKVTYRGYKGGYGKTIIIQHSNGYKTLYAHLNGYRKGIKRGKRVKKGQLIGYVGSTGMSTGPHLHFGVYKNRKPINPNRAVREKKVTKLANKEREEFFKYAKSYKNYIENTIASSSLPTHQEIKNPIYLANIQKEIK